MLTSRTIWIIPDDFDRGSPTIIIVIQSGGDAIFKLETVNESIFVSRLTASRQNRLHNFRLTRLGPDWHAPPVIELAGFLHASLATETRPGGTLHKGKQKHQDQRTVNFGNNSSLFGRNKETASVESIDSKLRPECEFKWNYFNDSIGGKIVRVACDGLFGRISS